MLYIEKELNIRDTIRIMLNSTTIKEIEDFVYVKPRSVQEIAEKIKRNWRTADRYINEIEKEFGTIATRVFREGTRGALKIVYWASIEKVSNSVFQEQLEAQIINGQQKEDFSAFDIFQHIKDKNKKASVEYEKLEEDTKLEDLRNFLLQAKRQILIFSGNLSFINLKNRKIDILQVFGDLIKKGVNIKILCRVDIQGKENMERMLSLNFKHGKENIEIRNREQPLRAIIADNKILRMKEIKEPTGKEHELEKKAFIFYTINDKEWSEWLSRIFWKMFSASIGSQKRLEEINRLRLRY